MDLVKYVIVYLNSFNYVCMLDGHTYIVNYIINDDYLLIS